MNKFYTVTDACDILGYSIADLRNWINRGVLIPTLPAPKRGVAAKFSYKGLLRIAIFMRLLDFGLDGKKCGILSSRMIDDTEEGPGELTNVSATVETDDGQVVFTLSVNIEQLVKKMKV